MKKNIFILAFVLFATLSFSQTIKRIDGTKISVDSIQKKIDYLMKYIIQVYLFRELFGIFSAKSGQSPAVLQSHRLC